MIVSVSSNPSYVTVATFPSSVTSNAVTGFEPPSDSIVLTLMLALIYATISSVP